VNEVDRLIEATAAAVARYRTTGTRDDLTRAGDAKQAEATARLEELARLNEELRRAEMGEAEDALLAQIWELCGSVDDSVEVFTMAVAEDLHPATIAAAVHALMSAVVVFGMSTMTFQRTKTEARERLAAIPGGKP
jgi:hypothetical protein